MHLPRNAPAALLLLPCILLASPPALEWRADLASRELANLYPRHGESASIECALTLRGAPYVPGSVSASVSTNGVWGDGWPAPATFASNVVTVSWGPELDPGDETLCLRIHVDGIHRPAAMLHLGPGGGGSTLPPPGAAIDFAETRYVNEPWATRSELRDATNALVIAAVDLSPYATWQGLDAATNAVRQGVDSALAGKLGKSGDTAMGLMTFAYGIDVYSLANFHGTANIPAIGDSRNAIVVPTVSGTDHYFALREDIVAATNGLLSAETELEAIRAAADAIELPEDPTAAELGAAFRELLLCIRNPVQARALRAAKGDAR